MKHFFAYLGRLRLIDRWGLMRNTRRENDAEHSFLAALIAHGIAIIAKERFAREVNPETVMALAVYHDAHEVITGDMPTPVKYHNPGMKKEYRGLEAMAADRLLFMLPEDLRGAYKDYLKPDEASYEWQLVKAADRICAYVKCLEEGRAGNHEFSHAQKAILTSIEGIALPEVQQFFLEFVPSFAVTLDELNQ